ncbi:hypothetical protein [Desulfofarcimen acetoxidans]|uniref:hypothetical protein n=1 Tax=Desulfofarcimen acetoxidans TaxID=58138 RepID=UPI000318C3EF|nr:hypothetical protein [Desulfofarcimen acetoxidans]
MTDNIGAIFDHIRDCVIYGVACPNCSTLFELDEDSDSIKCPVCDEEIRLP